MGSVSNWGSWKGARGTTLPLMLPCWQPRSGRMERELLAKPSLCSNSASTCTPGSPAWRLASHAARTKPMWTLLEGLAKGRKLGKELKQITFCPLPWESSVFQIMLFFGTCVQQPLHWCSWECGWKLLAKFASITSLAIANLDQGNEKNDSF